ncbi:hypothetical protein ACN95_04655 [Gordonia sihwensis]|nr:hypothetical protein [Gordonia sihwensis]
MDPVPRHRHAGLSLLTLLIAAGETLGDGVLGVILWQGGVLGAVAQQAMQRNWGPPASAVATDRPWFLDDPELSERFRRR